jgi:DNA (cytosine-5)-methyltransferase 1
MKHGSLFSGIGGFDLAAEWIGWENMFHCEWNPFGQKVLKYYWPNAISYGDITKTDFNVHRGKIDILTGGFPCQPYSTAGTRKGKEDNRHKWPQMLRAIREIQPTWVVGENVPGLLNWERGMVLAEIKADLEAAGFEVFPPIVLPACGKNAPHKRERLWIIAYSNGNGQHRSNGKHEVNTGERRKYAQRNTYESVTNGNDSYATINGCEIGERFSIRETFQFTKSIGVGSGGEGWDIEPGICGVDDGVSNRVDRIKALGNAIVPQVAYEIFKAIEKINLDL